jgi:hypothetical protein
MSADIRAFPGTSDPEAPRDLQPVDNVISELSDLLEQARRGEIRAFAAAIVMPGDFTTHCWSRGYGQHAHSLHAAISDLAFAASLDRHHSRNAGPVPGEPA